MDSHRHQEWVAVERTPSFQEYARKRKAFLIPATIFFMVFFFGLPVLASFTTVLNGRAIGPLTWAYVYGFAQFAMTWILSLLYNKRANRFDEMAEAVKQQALQAEKGNKEASA